MMRIDNETLMFFHSWLNWKLFDGKLEPAIVRMTPGIQTDDIWNEDGVEAQAQTELDPFAIVFFYDTSNEDPLYVITQLLHEMIHQHCRENDIHDVGESWYDDPEDEGKHLPAFFEEAEKHGLHHGYHLKDDTKQMIEKMLNNYDIISGVVDHIIEQI